MNEVKQFAPTVNVPGVGCVTPPGWMWQLGFAIGGCEWAIKECETEEWKQTVRDWFKARKIYRYEEEIKFIEEKLARLKAELAGIRATT